MTSTSITLKLDHREGKLKELIATHPVMQNQPPVLLENLEFGDIQILLGDTVLFIFERKTLEDLMASIKDGRYKNQKARLFQHFVPSQIYYIIEGSMKYSATTTNNNDKIIQSSVINTVLRDKVACFNTKNVGETLELIVGIFMRIKEDASKYPISFQQGALTEQSIVTTSAADTPQKVFKGLLCQIPGVSEKSAVAIMSRWPKWVDMYEEMYLLTPEDRADTLNSIKVNDRKISKRIVEGILKHLF